MVKALAIDLDDTLFSEIQYVYSGYREIAKVISDANGLECSDVYNQIIYQFSKYGRVGAFDRTMSWFEIDKPSTKKLVDIYRSHVPNISFYNGVVSSLHMLRKNFKLVVITDGMHKIQKNKVKALGLDKWVDGIIYCTEYNAPKPSILSLEVAAKKIETGISKMLFIGDDPYCDMIMANTVNIKSYRVMTGKYKNVRCLKSAQPDAEFSTFASVSEHIMEHDIDD